MATSAAEKKTQPPSSSKVADPPEESTYVISEQELRDLQEFQSFRKAIRILHTIDVCPECPTTYGEIWNAEPEASKMRILEAIIRITGSLNDGELRLHASKENSNGSDNSVNDARLQNLREHAAANILPAHPCALGHTGCV
ncbi:hypothetical protein [Nonomuraea sp. bgisy101]|uniref:hypothetical protein n=1 Tax=Nonomuraea sp. bgisy101 TaxID=3413784 RepID=UPI003D72BFB0